MAEPTYAQSQLLKDEEILTAAHTHWIIYACPAALAVLGILLLAVNLAVFSLVPLAAAAFLFLRAWIYAVTTELVVTNKRVLAKFGFIRRSTFEMDIRRVEGANLEQTVFGRLLGYGSIRVRGTGGGNSPIPYISDPSQFKRILGEQIS